VQGFNPFRASQFVAVWMQMYKRYEIRNQGFVSAEGCSISYLEPRGDTFPSLLLPYPWPREAEVSWLEPPHRLAAAFRSETSVKTELKWSAIYTPVYPCSWDLPTTLPLAQLVEGSPTFYAKFWISPVHCVRLATHRILRCAIPVVCLNYVVRWIQSKTQLYIWLNYGV